MIDYLDETILQWFQQIHNDALTKIFMIITKLGEAGIIWIIFGFLMLFALKEKKYGCMVLFSLLLCLIFGNGILKNLIARPRPCHMIHDIQMLIAIPKDYSFPSGHTFSSVAASICIWHWNRKYGILAWILAVVMMASRLYFYVHYPTDIFAGILLGTILAMISIYCVEKAVVSDWWKNRKTIKK